MSIHENSTAAYREANRNGKMADRAKLVLMAYRGLPGKQGTDRQIMEALGFSDMNSVRPTITTLVHDGWVEECDKTECPKTHKTVRVCRVRSLEEAQSARPAAPAPCATVSPTVRPERLKQAEFALA